MQIQVNAVHNTDGRERVVDYVRGVVEGATSHFGNHITHVEVNLGDEDGSKGGQDNKRCIMKARVERYSIAVTQHAATLEEAIAGAASKLRRSLQHDLDRRHGPR